MSTLASSYSRNLHNFIFRFVRKQRFVALRHGVPGDQIGEGLTATEQSILFILYSEPDKSVKELAELVGLERSWMSRAVSALEEKEFLKSETPEHDRRSKTLSLTKKGAAILEKSEEFVAETMKENLDTLNVSEQKEFHKLLSKFADGLGAKNYANNSSKSPIGYQLGRLSAGFGMYSEKMFGSDLTVTYLHTLLILEENKSRATQVNDINYYLPLDMSSVSRTLQAFDKKAWINKIQSDTDKRSYSVQLSKAGERILEKYFERVEEIFQRALENFAQDELARFLDLYEKVSGQIPYPVSNSKVTAGIQLREISDQEAKSRRKNLESTVKSQLADQQDRNVGIYQGDELKAVMSIVRSKKDGAILSLDFVGQEIAPEQLSALMKNLMA